MQNERCANASEPGVGKTPSACVYSWFRWDNDQARTYWAQPKSLVKKNWQEILRFTPFTDDDVVIVDGPPARRRQLIQSSAKVFLGTPETLKTHEREWPSDLQMLVGDEWSRMWRSNGSQRTQSLYRFMLKRKWLLAMTGTMIEGRLDSAYPFVKLVEPRYYGNYEAFMNYHAWTDDRGNILGWHNTEKLRRIMARHTIRRTFAEVHGPEAKVIQIENVSMTPTQRAKYDEFREQGLLELSQSWLKGDLPGVNLIRCRQIMGHPEAITDEMGGYEDLLKGEPSGKDERLSLHLLDHLQSKKPCVVFSPLVKTQQRIVRMIEALGMEVGLINGSVPDKERNRVTEEFQAGRLQWIVTSCATGGVGANWGYWDTFEVDHCIFEALDWLDGDFVQGYRRMIRGKRNTPLRITILAYEDSIDQRMFELVYDKSALANAVDPTREIFDFNRITTVDNWM